MRTFSVKLLCLIALILTAQLFDPSSASADNYSSYWRWNRNHNNYYYRQDNPETSVVAPSTTTQPETVVSGGSTTTTAPVLSNPPVPGMVMTFNDNFNDLSASSNGWGTTWQTRFYYNPMTRSNWSNLDLSPEVCGLGITPYSTSNGILRIHEEKTDWRLTACGVQHPYTSGNLYSYYSFWQRYGYFEIRMKASGVYGTTSTFWLLPKDGSWPPEIDVIEMNGKEPNISHVSNHTTPDNRLFTVAANAWTNLSEGFHTYGLLWSSESLVYYLDGKIIAQTPTGYDEHKPFYMIVGLGAGTCDSWLSCPPSGFTADSYVDYVRVWQFNDQNPAQCVGEC